MCERAILQVWVALYLKNGGITMSVELSDYDVLRQSIESVEPKEIFVKVLRLHEESQRRSIISVLGVDVKTCNPIYMHQDLKFKRKEHKKNMFLYIDKDYKVIGFTLGSYWNSDWAYAEDYSKATTTKYLTRNSVAKTRLSMWKRSFHILMFHERETSKVYIENHFVNNFRGINHLEKSRNRECDSIKASLDGRLLRYKDKKYLHISYEDLIIMMGKVLVALSKQVIKKEHDFKNIIDGVLLHRRYILSTIENAIIEVTEKLTILHGLFKAIENKSDYNWKSKYREYILHKLELIRLYRLFFDDIR
jgi:hypothetical protein